MRTARFCEPLTLTWATPGIVASRGTIAVSAYSCITGPGIVSEVSARNMIGASAGFTLRKLGASDRSSGKRR